MNIITALLINKDVLTCNHYVDKIVTQGDWPIGGSSVGTKYYG